MTNNNNNNNETQSPESIFWRIWRNGILKKEIFRHIRLYNNHFYNNQRIITLSTNDLDTSNSDIEELRKYKYSSYMKNIWIELDDDIPVEFISSRTIYNSLHKLPENINEILLYIYQSDRNIKEDIKPINEPIVPPSITKLTLTSNLVNLFGADAIPSTIKSLTFGGSLILDVVPRRNDKLVESIFPKIGLTSLDILLLENQTITKSTLPITLTKLVIDTLVKSKIKRGSLPNSLKYLSIGSLIKLKLGLLPNSLEYLEVNVDSIELGILPTSLKHLKFHVGSKFNQTIKPKLFHMGLETIEFGDKFNKSLTNLPTSITNLKLGGCFNKISTFYHLTSLTKLTIENDSLSFQPYWYLSTTPSKNNDQQQQPGLHLLEILNVNQKCNFVNNFSIPPKVWKLKYCPNFKNFKDNVSLKQISCEPGENSLYAVSLKPMDLPIELQVIKYFSNDVPLTKNLFSHLSHLHTIHFSFHFEHEILPNTFPQSITELKFSSNYDKPFTNDALPSNLKYLSINGFKKAFKLSQFPKSIEILEVFHLEDTPISGFTFPNLVTLIIWRDTKFVDLPIDSTLKSIFISVHNESILKQKDMILFDEYSSFIKVLNDTNGLSKVFKNKW